MVTEYANPSVWSVGQWCKYFSWPIRYLEFIVISYEHGGSSRTYLLCLCTYLGLYYPPLGAEFAISPKLKGVPARQQ